MYDFILDPSFFAMNSANLCDLNKLNKRTEKCCS